MSLPPACPKVSFDTELGQRFANLDFDYQAYYDLCTTAGFSDQLITDQTIYFMNKPASHYLPPYIGRYISRRRQTDIYVNRISDKEVAAGGINRVVIHETGHHDYEHTWQGKVNQVARSMVIINWFSELGFSIAETARTADPIPVVAGVSAFFGFAYAFGNRPHRSLPQERPAYEFEDRYSSAFQIVQADLLLHAQANVKAEELEEA